MLRGTSLAPCNKTNIVPQQTHERQNRCFCSTFSARAPCDRMRAESQVQAVPQVGCSVDAVRLLPASRRKHKPHSKKVRSPYFCCFDSSVGSWHPSPPKACASTCSCVCRRAYIVHMLCSRFPYIHRTVPWRFAVHAQRQIARAASSGCHTTSLWSTIATDET